MTRCLGWDQTLGGARCGAAYRQGGYLCETCSGAHYAYGDGSCAACPISAPFIVRYRGLLIIMFVFIGLLLLVYAMLATLVRLVGGTLLSTAGHAGSLFAWAVTTVQSVAQVSVFGWCRDVYSTRCLQRVITRVPFLFL